MSGSKAAKALAEHGLTRVVVSEGVAMPPRRAERDYGVIPEVAYVRDDGWSLGCTMAQRELAEEMLGPDLVRCEVFVRVRMGPASGGEPGVS